MTKPQVLQSQPVHLARRPNFKPSNPNFSSGPCAKRPGWSPDVLAAALLGRSHRSKAGKARIAEVVDRTRAVLGVPDDHRIAIVPASDTGAFEMALWTLLGPRGVDLLAWESFGHTWITDVVKQLKLKDVREHTAPYGQLPDLSQVSPARDVVFTWNGTTSGVRVPDGNWISADRKGLTLCDATSAAFAMDLPWDKLDATTYSWQKVLGGEAQHGILILSPRAVERLESYTPPWPLPKLFRLTKGGRLQEPIFQGETINTPSMLCVEDALDGLKWAEQIGGRSVLARRTQANAAVIAAWVANSSWADFLAEDPRTRSTTSVCLKIVDPWFRALDPAEQFETGRAMAGMLERDGVAYDIAAHRDAPPGLRIWCGATVETADVEALLPWLDWAWDQTRAERSAR
ncbi:MAG: phosphoserine transaminase [Alphaproteobacteria bacterium]|nr:phosphoserine transaminase [Alphaproteobacteria bacterium]